MTVITVLECHLLLLSTSARFLAQQWVSVVIANLVMEHIEEKALTSFSHRVLFWKRYVDDVCCALPAREVTPFLLHLNSIEPSIQFTCELEKDRVLPFLDVLIHRNQNGSISTSVFHKPMHTHRYLDFTSHHPIAHKAAVIRTLQCRAMAISSSPSAVNQELSDISKVLVSNGYPTKFINRVFQRSRTSSTTGDNHTSVSSVVIPYISGFSEAVRRILATVNIRVIFRPHNTLRQQLVKIKDSTPLLQTSNVVYSIPCMTCSRVYIGQTGRLLGTRIKEHKAAVKHAKTEESAVAEHVWVDKHQMDFQSVSILAREPILRKRLTLESWFIRKSSTINREVGPLPPTYSSLAQLP